MKVTGTFLTICMVFSLLPRAAQASDHRATCTPFTTSEQPFERDYQILNSKEDIDQDSISTYEGERRLKGRAYWDTQQSAFVLPYSKGLVKINDRVIKGLAAHFSKALQNRYADAIIYPDMGHAHLVLPDDEWTAIKTSTPETVLRINQTFLSPHLKALYHTAEMLQIKEGHFATGRLPQDPWKLWRYFSRNLLGGFENLPSLEVLWAGPTATYNTVRSIPQMTEVSTIYFVANKSGCFPFNSPEGEKYFDVTFETIPYKTKSFFH